MKQSALLFLGFAGIGLMALSLLHGSWSLVLLEVVLYFVVLMLIACTYRQQSGKN